VLLSHLLGLAQSTLLLSSDSSESRTASVLEAAFQSFDSIRRDRANKVVSTSREAGNIYTWVYPDSGSDMEKVFKVGNPRLPWIWVHDLEEDGRMGGWPRLCSRSWWREWERLWNFQRRLES
jgi:hypothetical protein